MGETSALTPEQDVIRMNAGNVVKRRDEHERSSPAGPVDPSEEKGLGDSLVCQFSSSFTHEGI
ncbi:MAG: hypothetical protein ACR2MC_10210 [Actinomycetota bacterium]